MGTYRRFLQVLIACIAVTVTVLHAPASVGAARPLRVALYGDSIGVEVADPVHFLIGLQTSVIFDENVYGGTNACDWFAEAKRDAQQFRPDVVIILFTGNAFTPCMQPQGRTLSSNEVAWKTFVDVSTLSSLFPHATVHRVGFARSRDQQIVADNSGMVRSDLINLLLAYTSNGRLRYVDGATPLLVDGRYSDTAPCAAFDPVPSCDGGTVQIRSADGMHLCPTAGVATAGRLDDCTTNSPGAVRLAGAIAYAVSR